MGIPRKNIRFLNGKSLISYSLNIALNSNYNLDVVVTTNDPEVKRIASKYGVQVIDRPEELSYATTTLDPVIWHSLTYIEEFNRVHYDCVLTLQPTSPLLKTETLDNAIKTFIESDFDSLISVVNNPHLSWSFKNSSYHPNYERRLNRQQLPKHFEETGGFLISKRENVSEYNRIGANVGVIEVSEEESIDIDDPQDWWVAERILKRKNIIIRVDGYSEIGLGHIYRGIVLADNLIDHNVIFVLSIKSEPGIAIITKTKYPMIVIDNDSELVELINCFNCDILINDILNTDLTYMNLVKSSRLKTVNFEDLGKGALLADVVINDLYENKYDLPNHYWGHKYYSLRDEFLIAKKNFFRAEVKEILVIFGGTDPSNITTKMMEVVKLLNLNYIHFTFVVGLGYKNTKELETIKRKFKLNVDIIQNVKNISDLMSDSDIAVSSQGRTMLELAHMRVPTILLSQNNREREHEFGYLNNGFINLGLGSEVDTYTIKDTLMWMINSPMIRKQMIVQLSKYDLTKGTKRVLDLILND